MGARVRVGVCVRVGVRARVHASWCVRAGVRLRVGVRVFESWCVCGVCAGVCMNTDTLAGLDYQNTFIP